MILEGVPYDFGMFVWIYFYAGPNRAWWLQPGRTLECDMAAIGVLQSYVGNLCEK